MGNRLFYIGMVLGLSACFLVLFAPCGLIFCTIHYMDKRKDREAKDLEAQRQAHIQRIIKLGQDKLSASIIVDAMREENIDPLLPDQPPNTPNTSPLASPILRAIYVLEERNGASFGTIKLYSARFYAPELGLVEKGNPEAITPEAEAPEAETPEGDTPKANIVELDTPELDYAPLVASNVSRVPTPPVPEPIPQHNRIRPFLGDGSPCLLVLRRSTPPPPPPNNSPLFSPTRSFLAEGPSRQRNGAEADLEAARKDFEFEDEDAASSSDSDDEDAASLYSDDEKAAQADISGEKAAQADVSGQKAAQADVSGQKAAQADVSGQRVAQAEPKVKKRSSLLPDPYPPKPIVRHYTDEERNAFLERAFKALDAQRPGFDTDCDW